MRSTALIAIVALATLAAHGAQAADARIALPAQSGWKPYVSVEKALSPAAQLQNSNVSEPGYRLVAGLSYDLPKENGKSAARQLVLGYHYLNTSNADRLVSYSPDSTRTGSHRLELGLRIKY